MRTAEEVKWSFGESMERRGRARLEGVFFVMTGSTGGNTGADWLKGVHRPDTVTALGKCRFRDKLIYLYLNALVVVDAVSYG